jgi:phosphoglycolate phosphatase
MNNKYKLLIFDWDGTLIDSEATIVSCMQAAIELEGMEIRSYDEIRNIIGLGLEEAIQSLFPEADDFLVTSLVESYRSFFFSDDSPQSQLFPGAKQAIQTLTEAGYLLAIATGKSRRGLDKELGSSDLEEYFPITRTAEETFSKPHPMMLDEIVVDCNVEVDEALMIGDSEYDLQMANNINMDCLAVTCGVHEQERLLEQNPVGLVHSAADIVDWLSCEQLESD